MALETADVQIIALVDLLGLVLGPEANAGMPDARRRPARVICGGLARSQARDYERRYGD
jgi:hypothetical protein